MWVLTWDDYAILPTVRQFHAQTWNLDKILCYKDLVFLKLIAVHGNPHINKNIFATKKAKNMYGIDE